MYSGQGAAEAGGEGADDDAKIREEEDAGVHGSEQELYLAMVIHSICRLEALLRTVIGFCWHAAMVNGLWAKAAGWCALKPVLCAGPRLHVHQRGKW